MHSEESLNLTTIAIRLNPTNYNFWIIRREILKHIKYDPFRELFWVEEIIIEQPKNSLSWYHRRIIAGINLSCISIETESKLTDRIIRQDAKNYFAFSHRQWSINTFKFENLGLLKKEIQYTNSLLDNDIRNNSAWNQRFFVMKQLGKYDLIRVKNEFSFTFDKIKKVNGNESAWNYFRGLLTTFGTKKLYQYTDAVDYCEHELLENKNCNSQIVAFIVDTRIELIFDDVINDSIVNCRKLNELCMAMASRYDKIRTNYWKFVHKKFQYDKMMKRRAKKDDSKGGASEDESWKSKLCKINVDELIL